MPCFYSVVRYVPDSIADERINIGVVVFGEGKVRSRFLKRWSRVLKLGGDDAKFLSDFASEFERHQAGLFSSNQEWSEERIRQATGRWVNSVQFSEPRGSLLSADELLDRIAAQMLKEGSATRKPRAEDRRAIVCSLRPAIGSGYIPRR